ncbi:3(2),5-bisphosphate nucleotidase HAL2 [Ramicandelaber brevisporus]|nr:3(2),5-bisphosphate nucleotidase HAL2 [Ramicandelaber brevisporus]
MSSYSSSSSSSSAAAVLRLAKERAVAIDAVLRASKLCRKVLDARKQSATDGIHALIKPDDSPVTIADYGAQAVVNTLLKRAFPDDLMVGEEDADDLRQPNNAHLKDSISTLVREALNDGEITTDEILDNIDRGNYEGGPKGRHWTLDPVDGTKGFLRGGQFAVCLALIEDGQVQLGVIGCPNLSASLAEPTKDVGCLAITVRGQGAFQRTFDDPTEIPIHARKTAVTSHVEETTSTGDKVTRAILGDALFCESVESGHSSHSDAAQIAAQLGITREPVRMDSQCKYACLARGDADIYLRLPVKPGYKEKIWDHAAGALLMHEAGGIVTTITGQPLDFGFGKTLPTDRGIIASSSPEIHEHVLKAVSKVFSK